MAGFGAPSRRRLVVVAVIAALLGGLLAAIPLPTKAATKTPVPPLPSSAPPAQPQPQLGSFDNWPAGDGVDRKPTNKPSTYNPQTSTVVDTETTPQKKVYDNHDGTRTAVINTHPVRFKDASGAWQDLDLNLNQNSDGTFSPKSQGKGTQAPGRSHGVITPVAGFGLAHPDATDTPASVSNRSATYKGGLPGGRDLVEAPMVDGLEESVILHGPTDASSYQVQLTMPPGITARTSSAGIEFVGADDVPVATFGGGIAHDSAVSPSGSGAEAAVRVGLVSQSGTAATVSVSVDPAWVADPARVFPVTVDPSFYANTSSGGSDTFVENQELADTSEWASTELRVGTFDGGLHVARSMLWFNVDSAKSTTDYVTEAHVSLFNSWSFSCAARPVDLDDLGSGFWSTTTWNNQPAPAYAVSTATFANGYTGCAGNWVNLDATTAMRNWFNTSETSWGLELSAGDEGDSYGWKKFMSGETGANSAPALFVTYDHMPNQASAASPADTAIVNTTTPTLAANAATDPDGDTVQYGFKIATGTDGESGQIVAQSGWIPGTSWTPPAGSLKDGVTYSWHVWTYDGTIWRDPGWARTFTVDLRLGNEDAVPYDAVGPAKVNLSNGNLVVSTSSPSLKTVGGDIGLSYTYNSQTPSSTGLTGTYFDDTNGNHLYDAGEPVRMVRQDPTVSFYWGASSPSPATIPADNFSVRWTGYITVPTTGTYTFGQAADDAANVTVNGVVVIGNLYTYVPGVTWGTQTVNLTAGTPVPIQIDYVEVTGNAVMDLWLKGPAAGFASGAPVPSTMLSTSAPLLPQGWSVSTDLDGSMSYVAASVSDKAVVLTDSSGATHTYKSTGTGYTPPPNEDGILTNANGLLTLQADDGLTYMFDSAGHLTSATSGADDLHPAAASYNWGVSPPRLNSITDPVSARSVTLNYGNDAACPTSPPSGFLVAPAGMLCKVSYWDGTVTNLWYLTGNQLGRIEDPGQEWTDFGYSGGLMTSVRDPLANDAISALVRANDVTAQTTIAYTGTKVASVTLPAPTTGAARPAHTYDYTSATQTRVHVAGLSEPMGFAHAYDFDAAGRTINDWDPVTNPSRAIVSNWDVGDRLLSRTDLAGRKTTTVYDWAQRPTDTYGPAPASCFNADTTTSGGTPNGTCTNPPVPHTATAYDTWMQGLAAAYWNNKTLTGSPLTHDTGVGEPTGALYHDWVNGSPVGIPNDGWSARYTGEILLPSTGLYTFKAYSDDGVRVWIDDTQVINDWADHAGWNRDPVVQFNNTTANSRHRIRVEYYDNLYGAYLQLHWVPPGGVSGAVPGADLFPRYGLKAFETPDDSTLGAHSTYTSYANPANGLATASYDDVFGLGLPTTTAYEAPGTGSFMRPVAKRLPAAVQASVVKDDNPSLYWRLGEGAGSAANDGSGHNYTGTYGASVAMATPGLMAGDPDYAKGFDGASTTVGNPTVNLSGATVSVEAWIKPTAFSNVAPYMSQIAGNVSPTVINGAMLRLGNGALADNAKPAFWVALNGGWVGATGTPLTAGNTYHVVGTYDGSAVRLYVNGTQVASTAATGSVGANAGFSAGYDPPSGARFFNGTIDEVAAYPTALSAARVSAHYANGSTNQAATTYTYYGATETPPTTGCAGVASNQGQMAHKTTNPDPDGSGPQTARTEESVYDAAGRVVAARQNADSWTCTTYDSRGRVLTKSIPAFGAEAARTVTNNYAVGGNPLVTSVADAAGTITTTTDLLGRVISYTDVWGKTTTSTYDQPGRLTDTSGPVGAVHTDYDAAGKTTAQKLDGVTVAVPTYSAAAELTSVSYPTGTGNGGNGTQLSAITRDQTGATTGLTWLQAGGASLTSDAVTRSQSGKVIDETVDGTDPHVGNNFVYDGAGRLTSAWVGSHAYTYAFAPGGGCGSATGAGKDTNRTSKIDNGVTTTYCYDAADRLISSSDASVGTPAYDSHGNTASLASQTLTYDGADRHVTTTSGGSTVRYTRDVTDRIVARAVGGVTSGRYGFSGDGDTPDFTMDPSNNVVERDLPLIGGVLLTKRSAGDVWSYPNVHGDVVATANAAGVKQGSTSSYDPFGVALSGTPDNSAGNYDYGWLGQHQKGLEHEGSLATIEMGARQYLPSLGRFLEVDPVEGGSANDYDYVDGDPVNAQDLAGTFCWTGKSHGKCRSWGKVPGAMVRTFKRGTITVSACWNVCVGISHGVSGSWGSGWHTMVGGWGSRGLAATWSPGHTKGFHTEASWGGCWYVCGGFGQRRGSNKAYPVLGIGTPGGWAGVFNYFPRRWQWRL